MALPAEVSVSDYVQARRIPDFFIVGHPKCGTSALYEMLRGHPQIFMPDLRQPRYFASEMRPRFQSRRTDAFPRTLDTYLALFAAASPDQMAGEASPAYLWSRTAAAAIAAVQPAARIIALIREPASFLRSLHLQLLQSHIETQSDLRKAISLEPARREGKSVPRKCLWPHRLIYSEYVRYVEQLRRYEAVFPSEQILVIIYDDFRENNESTVRAILRFLHVDDSAPIRVSEANPSVGARYQRLYQLSHALTLGPRPVVRAVDASLRALGQSRVRQLVTVRDRLVLGSPRPPDERFMLELRRRFKPEVVALSEHLGRDLVALWGYDRLEP